MADWTQSRLPVFFEAPDEPQHLRPIRVDEHTTPRKLVLRTAFGRRSLTVPAMFLIIGHQIGEALVPVVMGLAIDRGIATGDWAATLRWVAILAAVFAFLSFSYRFGSRIGFLGMQTIQHRLRTQVTDRILDPRGLGGGHSPGVLLSIATSDVQRLAIAVSLTLYPIGEVASVFFCGIVLFTVSWQVGLLVLVGAPLILWLLDKAGGPLRRRSESEQQAAGDAAASAADLVAGFRVIKGVHVEDEALRRYRGASSRALAAVIQARRSQGVYVGSMEAIAAVFVVAVGVVGGIMAVSGSLTVGQLITVVGLTQFVMGPLGALGTNFGRVWAGAQASAKRVLLVLRAPVARPAGDDPAVGTAVTPIRFDGVGAAATPVDLTLPSEGVTVIRCDADVAAQLTALLARTAPPQQGRVWAGETDLFALTEDAALRAVRVAPAATTLFEGSIADNIDSGAGDRVAAALLAAACEDIIEVLPNGLDTPVGEAGRLLSGGQRQRVALARALASDTETLVLVEPTSAVDSVTEATIAGRLADVRRGRATVIFTWSPTLVAVADTVVDLGRLDSGRMDPGVAR
ncbi:ABC transporter transmembrane domain-containing protein [Gordonia hydrophobica]|uniref:ABC transporter ATP-binding protein n=1 Tax=Gordonia hydrophobica TaxID=40516 RepID=A0ABZ2U2G8_9ACTN|nr:ABC transporter ATP-binding protein [Gordonia hydrophobica]MBM7369061.1 ABC-type multidrug transport system fused ATPase/permease subunit [Gordonia hydrophobica]